MAYCSKCGEDIQAGAAFCPKCGQPQTGEPMAQTSQSAGTGLSENVAGLLCYLLGWLTGIIFFLIDKRPYVRFHAAQSIVVFGGLHVLNIAIGIITGAGFMMGGWGAFGMGWGLHSLISLVALILWIVLMVKAHQGERFKVPIAAGIAESLANK
jgi:uncharacterized membrane protein